MPLTCSSYTPHERLTSRDEDDGMQRWRWIGSLAVAGIALVGAALAPTAATATVPRCAGTGAVAHRNLRYASASGVAPNLQSLDLYLPKRAPGCAPAPVVVWVHGGGFALGDKANRVADKVRLFTREGWAFASVNYRLAGDPRSGAGAGRYPAQQQDLAAALRYLRDHAREYRLRRDDTMLLGHSAGAFLVALEATDLSFVRDAGVPASSIRCTVPLVTEGYVFRVVLG
jgi:acetyl esterase/lipase